jgi:hypothetical protein
MDDETRAALQQLEAQQALTVQALHRMLEGRMVGADSAEAALYAIDPSLIGGELDPPVSTSQLEEATKKA